jgi:hypothetical protein
MLHPFRTNNACRARLTTLAALAAITVSALNSTANANELPSPPSDSARYQLGWSYMDATSGQVQKALTDAKDLPMSLKDGQFASHPSLLKTRFLIEVGNALHTALEAFEHSCDVQSPRPEEPPSLPPVMPRCREVGPGNPVARPSRCLPPGPVVCSARKEISAGLKRVLADKQNQLSSLGLGREARQYAELLDLGNKLAVNIETAVTPIYGPINGIPSRGRANEAMPMPGSGSAKSGGGLTVTGGGVQDFEFFRSTVRDGQVPDAASFAIEGLLSEFQLGFDNQPCARTICMNTGYLMDKAAKKLFIQLSMNSNVTAETFHRKPLDLALVIDISGSMSANDGTQASRLEWAKEAVKRTLSHLQPGDNLSVVVFDDRSEVVAPMAPAAGADHLAEVWKKVEALQTRGSTDVFAGLELGYQQVEPFTRSAQDREHRVILLSDAGLNTGETRTGMVEELVGRYAAMGIGLTAIGMGDDFRDDLVRAITSHRGGNAIYVQSGAKLIDYFDDFDFLVSPVAYDFQASLYLPDSRFSFAKAYGVPAKSNDAKVLDVMKIPTLFFAGPSSGGGALVLEYDMK